MYVPNQRAKSMLAEAENLGLGYISQQLLHNWSCVVSGGVAWCLVEEECGMDDLYMSVYPAYH